MGYMLPVHNYQYQDYHNRITKTKLDPYPIGRLSRAQLDEAYSNLKQLEERQPTLKKQGLYVSKTYHQTAVDKIYAELVGVGRSINERV